MYEVHHVQMKPLIVCFSLFLSIPFTCARHDDQSAEGKEMRIEAGFACGWGSGEDSLMLESSGVKYSYYVPSSSPLPRISVSRAMTDSEWSEIEAAVDFTTFLKLDYNTCNICVDGCDEWITINRFEKAHSIRFTKGQQIEGISALQDIIARYRNEFNKQIIAPGPAAL